MPSAFSYPAASIGVAGQIPNFNNTAMPIPALIGAGGAILGGLISGLFGSSSTRKANATNLKIAHMNNAYNREMFDRQIQYNWDMFNATNAYNTPEQQRLRLEQAGLNPYLMLDGGNAGTAQGGNSVSPPTAQAVQVQPYLPNFQSISDAFMQIAQMEYILEEQKGKARLANAQATGLETQNSFLRAFIDKQLEGAGLDNEIKQEEKRGKKLENDFRNQTFWSDVALHETNAEIAKNEQDLSLTKQAAAVLDMELAKGRFVIDQQVGASVITKNMADAVFSNQGARNLAEQLKGLVFDNGGKALDFDARYKLSNDIISTLREKLGFERSNYKNAPYQNKTFNTVSDVLNKLTGFVKGMNDIWNLGHGNADPNDLMRLLK